MARLKRDLLIATGNVHIYKEKNNYVVFKTNDQSPKIKEEDYPQKQSTA